MISGLLNPFIVIAAVWQLKEMTSENHLYFEWWKCLKKQTKTLILKLKD